MREGRGMGRWRVRGGREFILVVSGGGLGCVMTEPLLRFFMAVGG